MCVRNTVEGRVLAAFKYNRTLIFRPKFGEKNEVNRIKRTQKSSGKDALTNRFTESKTKVEAPDRRASMWSHDIPQGKLISSNI